MRGDAADSPIDRDALAAFGLATPASSTPPPIEIWPENEHAVRVFCNMTSSWTYSAGSGKPIGLRYEALPAVMRYCRIPKASRPEVFAALRVMEQAAVEELRNG